MNKTNITNEEKINFLTNLEMLSQENKKKLKISPSKDIVDTIILGLCSAGFCTTLILVALKTGIFPTILAGILSGAMALHQGLEFIADRKVQKKIINELSDGKLNVKQYFNLVNSGELDKWKFQFSEEINSKSNELNGIKSEEYKNNQPPLNSNKITNKITETIGYNNQTKSEFLEK